MPRRVSFAPSPDVLTFTHDGYDRHSVPIGVPSFLRPRQSAVWKSLRAVNGASRHLSGVWRSALSLLDFASALDSYPAKLHANVALQERQLRPQPIFTGIWVRSSSRGFVELLCFCGFARPAAEHADATESRHCIEFDHAEGHFHLVVRKGRHRIEEHYVLGCSPNVDASGGILHESCASYDNERSALTVRSTSHHHGIEVVSVRTLDATQCVLTLTQTACQIATGEKVQAISSFVRCFRS